MNWIRYADSTKFGTISSESQCGMASTRAQHMTHKTERANIRGPLIHQPRLLKRQMYVSQDRPNVGRSSMATPACRVPRDRDLNAARNIRRRGADGKHATGMNSSRHEHPPGTQS